MAIMRNMTIRHKLTFVAMTTCVVSLLLAGAAFILWQWNSLHTQMAKNLSTQAEIIADNCKAALTFKDVEDAGGILKALHVQPSVVLGCLYTDSGAIFASYFRDDIATGLALPQLEADGYRFAEGYLTVFKSILLDGEKIGTVCVQSDLRAIREMIKHTVNIVIAVLLCAVLAAYLISSPFQKIISGPILELAEAAKAVSVKKDYSVRAGKHGSDEVGFLTEAFNDMLSQIQKRDRELVGVNEQLETRVRQRTAELLVANERLQYLLSSTFAVIYTARPASNYAPTYVSENVFQLSGYASDKFSKDGDFWVNHIHPQDRQRVLNELGRLPEQGHKAYEYRFLHANGSYIWVRDETKLSRDERGRPVEIIGCWIDITDRKEAEAALEQVNKNLQLTVEELSHANLQLHDFAHIIAHDLKAPLRAIGTLAEWLVMDYADKFDEAGKQQVMLLQGRAERMSRLVDGILRYSEVGRLSQQKTEVNLNELVKEAIRQLNPPESISITVENELPVVMCEKAAMMQVFQNLLSNAVKFMDKPNGEVRIGCSVQDGHWKFSVKDNGPGIDQKYHTKIFKIFQTLLARDDFESTGIGLSVVKKTVELYGGSIWVESAPGQGSTFYFTFPRSHN